MLWWSFAVSTSWHQQADLLLHYTFLSVKTFRGTTIDFFTFEKKSDSKRIKGKNCENRIGWFMKRSRCYHTFCFSLYIFFAFRLLLSCLPVLLSLTDVLYGFQIESVECVLEFLKIRDLCSHMSFGSSTRSSKNLLYFVGNTMYPWENKVARSGSWVIKN